MHSHKISTPTGTPVPEKVKELSSIKWRLIFKLLMRAFSWHLSRYTQVEFILVFVQVCKPIGGLTRIWRKVL